MKENDASYSIVKVGDTIVPSTPKKLFCASEDNLRRQRELKSSM